MIRQSMPDYKVYKAVEAIRQSGPDYKVYKAVTAIPAFRVFRLMSVFPTLQVRGFLSFEISNVA